MVVFILLSIAALYLFYATKRSANRRRSNHHSRFLEKQEELIDMLRQKQSKAKHEETGLP